MKARFFRSMTVLGALTTLLVPLLLLVWRWLS